VQGNPFGSVESGTWLSSAYWYLLSEDARVQCGYRIPRAPNGDIAQFDYDGARREAPQDRGSHTRTHLTFVMGVDTVEAFIVTNPQLPNRAVVRFYNKRGTAEQWIKEGKQAADWTRLSCHRFRANEVRL
jgi:hypothetical protein